MDNKISNSPLLYQIAKECLGKRCTLNAGVPEEVGCAEALSFILSLAKTQNLPILGYAGTADMTDWLENDPQFIEIDTYEPGAIIMSATGSGNGKIPGHCGICLNLGIGSNNSDNGLFQEKWTVDKWKEYYEVFGGMKIRYFRMIIK